MGNLRHRGISVCVRRCLFFCDYFSVSGNRRRERSPWEDAQSDLARL